MLENNLDPDVAEDPANLVVYGGTGKAARTWDDFHAIVATLQRLEDDETLLVQSRPPGRRLPHPRDGAARADRELACSCRTGPTGTSSGGSRRRADDVRADDRRVVDLHRHAGHRAGHVRDVRGDRRAALRRHRSRGGWSLTAGCGGMGGAQPLAVAMLDGVCLIADVDPHRLARRVETRYLDLVAPDLDTALREVEEARAPGEGRSIGVVDERRRAATRRCARRGVMPDVVTDQTAAHDPLVGYIPDDLSLEDAAELRESRPAGATSSAARTVDGPPVRDDGRVPGASAPIVVDYGNNLRTEAEDGRLRRAPSTTRASCRPTCGRCSAAASGRSAGRRSSGNPDDIAATDAAMRELFPDNVRLQRWLDQARSSASRSRACPRASAGSATATATAPACASTSWCAAAR